MTRILYTNEIVGSKLFKVDIEDSDTDYFFITNDTYRINEIDNKIHKIYWPIDEGLNELLCILGQYKYELCTGFGKKNINNELNIYIEKNKEEFKYQNIGNSFNSFLKSESLLKKNLYGRELYNQQPKINMYIILYKYIFANYPNNKSIEECIYMVQKINDFLIAMRKHNLPYQEVLNFELSLRRQLSQVKSFYVNRFNDEYAAREKEKMKQIIQNLEY